MCTRPFVLSVLAAQPPQGGSGPWARSREGRGFLGPGPGHGTGRAALTLALSHISWCICRKVTKSSKGSSLYVCTALYILSVILLRVEENVAEESRRSSPAAATRSPVAGERGTAGIVAATGELFFWTLYIGLKFISHPGGGLTLVAAPSLDANRLSRPVLHIF